MTKQAPTSAPASMSLWRRVVTATATLIVILALVGGITIYQSIRLQRLSEHHAMALNIEAATARGMFHAYQISDALQKAYITHNPKYIRESATPHINALKQDAAQIAQYADKIESPDLQNAARTALKDAEKTIFLAEDVLHQADLDNWSMVNTQLHNLREHEAKLLASLAELLSMSQQYHSEQTQPIVNSGLSNKLVPLLMTILGIVLLLSSAFAVRQLVIRPLIELDTQVQKFAAGDLSLRLPVRRDDEIGHLAHTFNLMADKIQGAYATLAQRVEERTRALQRRTAQMQAASEIGRAVATLHEMNTLLGRAALLISQRYEFHHVGIFLTNEAKQAAVLRAAYSQEGRAAEALLAQNYTVSPHSNDIVGLTLSTGNVHTQQFKSGEHPIPELSATRSEIAIPLKHGDEMLGVLDVHDKKAEGFSPEDITALQAVADMLAVAIANARFFQETQAALEAARRAYDQISQAGWQRFLQIRRVLGFRLDDSGQVHPVALPESPDSAPEAASAETSDNDNVFRFPVKARGRTIAIARLRKATPWNASEKQLIQKLSERLGAAMESARLYAEAQRRAAQLQIASEIARDASSTLDLEELLDKTINLIRERFNFYHAAVFLLDESGQYAYIKAATGEAGRQLKARQHRLAVGSNAVVGQTLARGEPVIVNDVRKSDIHQFNPLLPDTLAELGIPLKIGDEIIGVLDIQATMPQAFNNEDVRVFSILSDQLAIAVINARLFAETQKHLHQHRLLHQITAAAASATDVKTAMRNVVESLQAIRPGEGIALFVPDEKQPETLRIAAWAGHTPTDIAAIQQRRIPFGKDTPGKAAATRQSIIAPDTSALDDYEPITPGMRSRLTSPLIYRDELIGVLDLESPLPNAYNEHDLEINRTLANSLASIIANIRLLEQVRQHSNELELLYEVTSAAASHVDLDQLLAELTERMQRSLDLLHCGVILFDENGETGTLVASASADEAPGQDLIGAKLPLNTRTIQEVQRTLKPLVCRDVAHDELVADIRDLLLQRGTRQLVVLPLLARDQVVGTIGLDIDDPEREITDDDLRLLEQIAHQVATSIEVARLFRQAVRTAERERLVTEITTKIRATTDPQTMLQTAVEELRQALRAQQTQIVFLDDTSAEK